MGVDIHMSIVGTNGEFKHHDIFEGRNSEWFDNISHSYHTSIYQNFPRMNGVPEKIPDEIKEDQEDGGYYDFYHVRVGEFMDWFEQVRPDIDAGWVCTYEKWLYEEKGIVPEVSHYLDESENPYDYHFIKVENPWDCSRWLYDFLVENKDTINPEDFIVYYFDC